MRAAAWWGIALLAAVCVLMLARPAKPHDHWISRNPDTRWCCNRIDCRVLEDGEAAQIGGQWYVAGQPIISGHVYPVTSDDPAEAARFHACFFADGSPRCLFIPALF